MWELLKLLFVVGVFLVLLWLLGSVWAGVMLRRQEPDPHIPPPEDLAVLNEAYRKHEEGR